MCFNRMVGSSTGSLPRPLKLARLMVGHPIARNLKASSRNGATATSTPSLPQMRYKQKDDLTDETLRPEQVDGEAW